MFDDVVNELAPKFEQADGLVVASPVYYASANATLVACLDRLFYSTSFDKTMKVGASVACARRGGCSATFDELNKYFTISGMPVASSQYWKDVYKRQRNTMAINRGKQSREAEQIPKSRLSSDCRLKPACMKLELLVIADQHAAVNTFPGLVHTARHTMRVGNTRSP